ncbi:hypothetical protein ABBQ38_001320 [Trebouxia sp. C0009 RCD-2024]
MRLERPLREQEATDGADLPQQLLQQLTRVLTGQKSNHQEHEAPPEGASVTLQHVMHLQGDAPPSWGGGP